MANSEEIKKLEEKIARFKRLVENPETPAAEKALYKEGLKKVETLLANLRGNGGAAKKEEPAAVKKEEEPEPVKKQGRGRPKKEKTEDAAENKTKKQRGRPAGSVKKKKEEGEEGLVKKQGRGRPAGAKNKNKKEKAEKPKKVSAGRGRPKKAKNEDEKISGHIMTTYLKNRALAKYLAKVEDGNKALAGISILIEKKEKSLGSDLRLLDVNKIVRKYEKEHPVKEEKGTEAATGKRGRGRPRKEEAKPDGKITVTSHEYDSNNSFKKYLKTLRPSERAEEKTKISKLLGNKAYELKRDLKVSEVNRIVKARKEEREEELKKEEPKKTGKRGRPPGSKKRVGEKLVKIAGETFNLHNNKEAQKGWELRLAKIEEQASKSERRHRTSAAIRTKEGFQTIFAEIADAIDVTKASPPQIETALRKFKTHIGMAMKGLDKLLDEHQAKIIQSSLKAWSEATINKIKRGKYEQGGEIEEE